MAMEMTHVRFALELMSDLDVADRGVYLSGAVYPDSRYYTHIERDKTHGDHVPVDPFDPTLTDFEKGWATHIFYDRQNKLPITALSPTNLGPLSLNSPSHVFHTCVKLIEDRHSYDILERANELFHEMETPLAPNGEDQAKLEHYYQVLRELYLKKPEIENYLHYFAAWGCPQDGLDFIDARFRELVVDTDLVKQIDALFPTTLAIAESQKKG